MSNYVGAVCCRCGRPLEGDFFDACPHCAKEGVNVNWKTVYDVKGKKLPEKNNGQPGIFRFREFYPMRDDDPIISLGEGNTPLLHVKRMGTICGTENLYIKDEGKNPCLSQKDRLCALQVSKALAAGAPGVVVSSTGSQGASTAAYASAAGIPCVIFTVPNVSLEMKAIMRAYGGQPFIVPTMTDRLIMMRQLVYDYGYYPCSGMPKPPIGSSCFGVDAYKSIAFELYEEFNGKLPDWIVMPISYGGTLHGIYQGLMDLKEMGYIDKLPKLCAAEVYGPAMRTIEAGKDDPIPQDIEYASDVIAKTRLIKTPEEVVCLKKAIDITEGAIHSTMEQVWIGMTEKQMLRIYYEEVVRRGGLPSLNCIAFGSHSAHANVQPTDYVRLEKNQPIRFDIGCIYEHYHADTARCAVIGKLSRREEEIFGIVADGVALAVDMIKPGLTFGEVFNAAMVRMNEKLPHYTRSHIGHGIGVEVYDPPVLGNSNAVFRENMVMCVEAPYYEVGLGGYQVEELIHITKNGAEVLSKRPVGIMEY